jgi:hypothetical protein
VDVTLVNMITLVGPPTATAILGYYLAVLRFRKEKRLEFIQKQITELYAPMVGSIKRIRVSSGVRVELGAAGNLAWNKICEENPTPFLDFQKHSEPLDGLIEYENRRFPTYILPLYDEMVDRFTKYYWVAENTTRDFYQPFCRYVELWHRYYDDTLPPPILQEVRTDEKPLEPFYDDLERTLGELRMELSQGKRRRARATKTKG